MTAAVILAAGASTRLGQPKQSLLYHGISLLRHTVQQALEAGCQPVIVVLGAAAPDMQPHLQGLPVQVALNRQWQQGMAASIQTGIAALQQGAPVNGAFIMLCDQPFVNAALLRGLLQAAATGDKQLAACAYSGTMGPPAWFAAGFFPALMALKGPEGARKILQQHKAAVALVPFEEGSVDIDTWDDYNALIHTRPGNLIPPGSA